MSKTIISVFLLLVLACHGISYSQQSGACQDFLMQSGPAEINTSAINPHAGTQTSSPMPESAPVNNSYASAAVLTVNAPCVNGTNKQATTQAGEAFGCQGTPTKTVWYKFTATAATMFVEVELTASSNCYLSSAVWNASGPVTPPTGSPISCEDVAGGPSLNIHHLSGLTINNTYYVQVSYNGGGFCGNNSQSSTGADFCIKAGTPVVCSTCATPCGPVCQFPSMPNIFQVLGTCTKYDLKPRLNFGDWQTSCFTFTAISSSLNLQMLVLGTWCVLGNVTQFNWTVQSAACGAPVSSGNLNNLTASGLTVGGSYVLCLTWDASCQHNSVYPFVVSSSTLPVELTDFSAEPVRDQVRLKWTTASELNNDYFAIERSTDGITFQTLEKIKGAGNHNGILNYTFYDKRPLQGNAIYRLKQQDFDGGFTLSKKVAVRFANKEDRVTIIPNPVKNDMHIKYYAAKNEQVTLQVTDMKGVTVLSRPIENSLEGLNLFSFYGISLRPGVYMANLVMKDKTITARFVME